MVVLDPTKATKAHAAHTRPGTTKHTYIIYHFIKAKYHNIKAKNTRKTAKIPLKC